MTYTIWKNGGKFEWIVRKDESIIGRSGMIFNTYNSAKRAMMKWLEAAQ